MICPIVKDPMFLARKAQDAGPDDLFIARDLEETLRANLERCVGMAANMIGHSKRIIAIVNGRSIEVMLNPRITEQSGEYEAEEGCLSLTGKRKAKRYDRITVEYQNNRFQTCIRRYRGFTAQIIQHEIDHTNGILI